MNHDHENADLTQQQLKDIYADKITSWKAVGGADRPIIAFQRNADSGSHTRRENAWGANKSRRSPEVPGNGGFISVF